MKLVKEFDFVAFKKCDSNKNKLNETVIQKKNL